MASQKVWFIVGNRAEWEFGVEPGEINSVGETIYYYKHLWGPHDGYEGGPYTTEEIAREELKNLRNS
jgi:hypothetical protein